MAYGLPLKGEGDEKCLSILNSVEETISRQLRACKAPSSKKKALEGSQQSYPWVDLMDPYLLLSSFFFQFNHISLTNVE